MLVLQHYSVVPVLHCYCIKVLLHCYHRVGTVFVLQSYRVVIELVLLQGCNSITVVLQSSCSVKVWCNNCVSHSVVAVLHGCYHIAVSWRCCSVLAVFSDVFIPECTLNTQKINETFIKIHSKKVFLCSTVLFTLGQNWSCDQLKDLSLNSPLKNSADWAWAWERILTLWTIP